MKNFIKGLFVMAIALVFASVFFECGPKKNEKEMAMAGGSSAPDPFQDNNGVLPPDSVYSGPMFTLNHNYPATLPPPNPNPPWIQALGGQPIGPANALAYVDSLKAYVSSAATQFLYDRANWNSATANWYQEPWTGSLREPILGTYTGSPFGANTFTTLDSPMTTYVLTMYDQRAAHTLYTLWGTTADSINLLNNAAQFDQGSVIIKFAFTTANYPLWSDMQGADTLPIYDTYLGQGNPPAYLHNVSLFQFDIIVKDTITAPQTGWVFSTLVYDKNAPGNSAWDKMVPLGATWGNDPNVISTGLNTPPLAETYLNPNAPGYSTQTLGWGGRLSGPNDGAVIPEALLPNGTVVSNLASVGCMGCHSVAQGPCCNDPADTLAAFLLPTYWSLAGNDTMPVFQPGGPQWMQWFQNRPGTGAFSTGQTGVDFDMVTCFKSMLMMYGLQNGMSTEEAAKAVSRTRILKHLTYSGR